MKKATFTLTKAEIVDIYTALQKLGKEQMNNCYIEVLSNLTGLEDIVKKIQSSLEKIGEKWAEKDEAGQPVFKWHSEGKQYNYTEENMQKFLGDRDKLFSDTSSVELYQFEIEKIKDDNGNFPKVSPVDLKSLMNKVIIVEK